MFTHITRALSVTRTPLARPVVTVALPIILLAGSSGAHAQSLNATHAPGGFLHTTIAQIDSHQTEIVSRSVGLMDGAQQ